MTLKRSPCTVCTRIRFTVSMNTQLYISLSYMYITRITQLPDQLHLRIIQ